MVLKHAEKLKSVPQFWAPMQGFYTLSTSQARANLLDRRQIKA
jgi:hypothetical protein